MYFIKTKCHTEGMHTCILLGCSEETEEVNYWRKTSVDKSEQTLVKLYLYSQNKEYTIGQ